MSILDKVVKTKPKSARILLYGRPGIGKSSFAASFPSPLFLLTEETGLTGIQALPLATTFKEFWDNVKELLEVSDLPFKTLVIDSVSQLDALITDHILEKEVTKNSKPATLSSACGGFGAGFQKAAQLHRALKSMLDRFQDKGVTVIYISHMAVKTHRAPDVSEYDVYTIVANHDKTREVYIDTCDAVLFCRIKSYTDELENGRTLIKSTDQRIMMCGVNDVNVSKNRFGMPNEIPMSYEEISKYLGMKDEKE